VGHQRHFGFSFIFTTLVGVYFLFILPLVAIGFMWVPAIGDIVTNIISGGMDGTRGESDPQPLYSMAEKQRRNSHPQEAMQAVREQLEKFPGDFPGVMLLASIQAEDLNDLPGAQSTLENWMQGPAATTQGIASSLTALADWNLEFAQDPEAARVALQKIVDKFPDTAIAHRAAQRLAHLPTLEYLLQSANAKTIGFRPGEKNVGLREEYTGPVVATVDPSALVEEYVKQLEKHTADTGTREKLALLYAESFNRLDLAIDQLEQLINCPHETPRRIVQWLNLLADWHIRFGKNEAAAKAALQRILDQFSTPALVEPTMARMAALHGEMKAGQRIRIKPLGQYEKDLGLKQAGLRG
jgi:tetratricopeptide (TPR) repeat protein